MLSLIWCPVLGLVTSPASLFLLHHRRVTGMNGACPHFVFLSICSSFPVALYINTGTCITINTNLRTLYFHLCLLCINQWWNPKFQCADQMLLSHKTSLREWRCIKLSTRGMRCMESEHRVNWGQVLIYPFCGGILLPFLFFSIQFCIATPLFPCICIQTTHKCFPL